MRPTDFHSTRRGEASLRFAFVVIVLALALPCAGQTSPDPVAYVSTGAGHQILSFSTSNYSTSPTINVVCTESTDLTFMPEDVVVGPDALLYVADTTAGRIFRIDPTNAPLASCTSGPGVEKIYDKTTSTCIDGNANAATCPSGPEGPSFVRVRKQDLYFSSHGAGAGSVWKISDVANVALGSCAPGACPIVQVLTPASTSSSGEGIDFDIFGNLLTVDQGANQVRKSTVLTTFTNLNDFSGSQSLITSNLSSPVGIALDTCGDVLVASGTSVNRYNSATGAFLDSLRFSNKNRPQFLEVDSSNHIYLVTSSDESGTGGTVWRYDPASLTDCTLSKYRLGFSVGLKKGIVAGVLTGNALGVGLSASNVTITKAFSASAPTALFDFGAQHSVQITCNNVVSPFTMSVTAQKSRPPQVVFEPVDQTTGLWTPANPTPTQPALCPVPILRPRCVSYGSQHGFCTEYSEATFALDGTPVSDTVVCSSTTGSNFSFKYGYFTGEPIVSPGGAHSYYPTLPNTYTECQSQDFYSTAGPGLDAGARLSGSNSKHVMFNSDLQFPGPTTLTVTSPVSSCGTQNGCNPQFNYGQNIAVKFRLMDATGAPINTATEQLSILLLQHTTRGVTTLDMKAQPVVATKNSATANFFVPNGSGQYSYNVDSSKFDNLPKGTAATFQFTIWGNGAVPTLITVIVQY